MNYVKSLSIAICVFVLWGCASQNVNQSSKDKLYKKENNDLNAKYLVYHINDSISQLFYSISNETLVYKRTDTSAYFYSDVKLELKTSPEDDLNSVSDTASVHITDRQADVVVKELSGSLYFKVRAGANYYTDVHVYDVNKKALYTSNIFVDKMTRETRQNFLVTNSRDEVFFFSSYKPQEVVYLRSVRNSEKLFSVDYFKAKFKLALPPFSAEQRARFSYKPDSTFSVYSNNDKIELSLPSNGFFHLKTNEQTKDGVTFFVYEPTFPKIKDAEQMIHATRYIMAKKEYDNCIYAEDKKTAIDKFWLDIGGSNERAKELIRKYYGRVQEANKLFSSYQEGWKTDRGMIYIVFGAPNKVSKRKNGELWTYGETGNPNPTVFSFIKVINPFTDNDYFLERNEVLKAPWYQAVDLWRQGRIYLDN
jgi:GWxTD domain-containing protein